MKSTMAPTPEVLQVFDTLPEMYLILSPDLDILAASYAYLKASMKEPDHIVVRPIFEVFPDNSPGNEIARVEASLQQVLATQKPHQMDIIRYDLAHPTLSGEFVERYWHTSHTPVPDETGCLQYIIHHTTDVTEQVKVRQHVKQARQQVQTLNEDLAATNEELRATNEELVEAKNALEQLNAALEERVALRTQEAKRAQAETKRQKDRLERFFMQAPAVICILDGPELVFELINPLYQQIFPKRNLSGKPLLEVLPEIANQPIWTILQNVYQTGETFEGREVLIPLARHEGGPVEDIYFNFIYQARFNEQGRVDGILVFAYEVSDHVLARQNVEQLALKVEQQAQSFDTVLTALQDFVYTFDTHGRFTYANKPLLDLLGITLNQLVGKNFHELPYPQKPADTLQAHIAQVVTTGQPLTAETQYANPEGNLGYYEYIFKPVFDQQQQVVLVAGSTRDITERKQSEEALRIKNEELVRINADLDNFIYTASHDLKAPITNIESLLTALLRTLPAESLADERTQRITAMMQQSVERFKRTIANLTEVVKLQKENSGEAVSVNLSEVIGEVRLDLESMIRSSVAELTIDVASCPSVYFSEKNLRSVIYNLLSNAIKYRSPERLPQVLLHCGSTPEYHVLTVKDNGLGMKVGRNSQLFTMFRRFHDHVEGSGIGLYMVKKIVENAGGKIEVESQVDVGSTFWVYFRR